MSFPRKLVCIESDPYTTPMLHVGEIYMGQYIDYASQRRVEIKGHKGWIYFSSRFKEISKINSNTIVI
jgi:hypothetical protein